MKFLFLLAFLSLFFTNLSATQLQKAKTFDNSQKIDNWLMSEKLDGIRAYWNGKELLTRKGNTIQAPNWFIKNFPPFELDGELWSKRMDFENIQSIVLTQKVHKKWEDLTYNIFEVPNAKGDFIKRLKKAEMWFIKNKNSYAKIIPQKVCRNTQELEEFLKEVIANKGEGVMLKNPNSSYKSGLNNSLLKVKKFYDTEGVVIAYNYNENKFKSLVIELPNKITFNLGNGFTKAEKQNPPKIGSVITFKYYGFTKNAKPKFASFLHVRKD